MTYSNDTLAPTGARAERVRGLARYSADHISELDRRPLIGLIEARLGFSRLGVARRRDRHPRQMVAVGALYPPSSHGRTGVGRALGGSGRIRFRGSGYSHRGYGDRLHHGHPRRRWSDLTTGSNGAHSSIGARSSAASAVGRRHRVVVRFAFRSRDAVDRRLGDIGEQRPKRRARRRRLRDGRAQPGTQRVEAPLGVVVAVGSGRRTSCASNARLETTLDAARLPGRIIVSPSTRTARGSGDQRRGGVQKNSSGRATRGRRLRSVSRLRDGERDDAPRVIV